MIEVETQTTEVEVINNVEVTSTSQVEVETVDLGNLDITVAKKEYVITGDNIYIPMLYDDAPQWMKDLVQVVVDVSISSGNQSLINDMNAIIQDFAVSYVPLNQYTQSILDLGDEDSRINALITTLNSNFSDGLSSANSQIIEMQLTKASKDEVVAQVIQTIAAQLADGASNIGSTIGRIDQAIADETSARATSFQVLTSSLEDTNLDVTANATATSVLNTYVGLELGAPNGTGLLADVEILQKQNDGVIETTTGTYDVMISPENPDLAQLVVTAEPYVTWKASDVTGIDTRLAHIGDVYVKYADTANGAKEYVASYKFIRTVVDSTSPYATDTDGFTWALIVDQAAQDAYEQALNAFDLADNKRRVFVATPVVPYDIGDLWLVQTGASIIGTTQGGRVIQVGDMLRCAETKTGTGLYEHNDWIPADSYREGMNAIQTDLNSWRTGTYAPFVTSIQSQVDGKAETFYQNSVPIGRIKSTNVANNTTLNKYVGDLWKNTYAGTISGYLGDNTEYIYTKIANGSNWNYDWTKMEVPDIVFDTIDTKKSIYSGNSLPIITYPDTLEINDMWITGDAPVGGRIAKTIYTWNGVLWVIPVRYTDDQYAMDIVAGTTQIDLSDHINSLGWTDDATVDEFIISTYAKDMLNIGNQLDGVAVTYFQATKPYLESVGLSEHSGDVWFNTSNETAFKFVYKTVDASGNVLTPSIWEPITNTVILNALKAASKTKAAADRSIKNFTTTTVPSHPFYIGDTWMEGSSGNIYVCNASSLSSDTETQRRAKWVIASKYTDDTSVTALQNGLANGTTTIKLTNAYVGTVPLTTYLSSEIDGKVGVYSGITAPVAGQPSGVSINDIYLWMTTASKVLANGTTQTYDVTKTYKYSGSAWVEITTNSNITALADLADGKRTVFSGNTVPTVAVERDIWIPSADVNITTSGMCTVAGGTWNGTVCSITKYSKGDIYQYLASKWALATKYSADIASVSSNLQTQLDGKVDTYYQATVPTGMLATNNGDYWYCTADVSTYKKGKVYKYVHTTTSWAETADVSRYAFDTADGKASIFTSATLPNVYKINDLLIIHADNAVGTYTAGVVLTATATRTTGSFTATEWAKKINDTEDLDAYKGVVNPQLTSLQNQVDGKIESWYTASTSDPKSAWTDAQTRAKHDGDMWYQTNTKLSYYYSSSTNSWNLIDDAKAILALSNAATAQATADGKISSYYLSTLAEAQSMSSGWTAIEKANNVGDLVVVWNDTTLDNNGTWRWNGTSWVTTRDKKLIALASDVTALSTELDNGTNTWASADSTLENSLLTEISDEGARVESKFAYNSIVGINGVYKKSGFGLTTNYVSGSGTEIDPYVSEFWIDASRFKFTNSNVTGSVAPFTIDASGTTPKIKFNGVVEFSNVSGTPGSGTNLLYNSAPKIGNETKGWSIGWSNHGLSSVINSGFDQWRPTGGASVYITVPGSPGIGTVFDINNSMFPVIANTRYEASAYLSSHRCSSWVTLAWFDINGNYISESGDTSNNSNASSGPLSGWSRSTMFATAPSNAATAKFYVRSAVTGDNPYCFVSYAYAGIASTSQTIFSNWSEGSSAGVSSSDVVTDINNGLTTTINGPRITTGSITAAQINVNDLFAQNITYTGTITGGNVAGGGIIKSYNNKMKIDLVNGSIYIS